MDNIKYVNLGTFIYNGKKYLSLLNLKPSCDKKFFGLEERSGKIVYMVIDSGTEEELNQLFNKKSDVVYDKKENRIILFGVATILVFASYALGEYVIEKNQINRSKSIIISPDLKAKIKSHLDNESVIAELIEESEKSLDVKQERDIFTFEDALAKNTQISGQDRELLKKLNEKMNIAFDDIYFNNFYRNISSLNILHVDRDKDEKFYGKGAQAYYNPPTNTMVICTDTRQEEMEDIFFHEGTHVAHFDPLTDYAYPFCRILSEGTTQIIANAFARSDSQCYSAEQKIDKILLEFIDSKDYFDNFYLGDDTATISLLAESLKDHDKVIAMLSNAEEYFQKKDKIVASKDKNKVEELDINHNITNFLGLLSELYYNKLEERVSSDYYKNGSEDQNLCQFLADTESYSDNIQTLINTMDVSYLGGDKQDKNLALEDCSIFNKDYCSMYKSIIEEQRKQLESEYCQVNGISPYFFASFKKGARVRKKMNALDITPELKDSSLVDIAFKHAGDDFITASYPVYNTENPEIIDEIKQVSFIAPRYKKIVPLIYEGDQEDDLGMPIKK